MLNKFRKGALSDVPALLPLAPPQSEVRQVQWCKGMTIIQDRLEPPRRLTHCIIQARRHRRLSAVLELGGRQHQALCDRAGLTVLVPFPHPALRGPACAQDRSP